MFVRPFEYVKAESVEEASGLLAEHGGEARLLAGGQSLMPMVNLGLAQPEALIDITFIPGLAGIEIENGRLRLGALTRYRAVERDPRVRERQPLLAEAITHVGNARVRNVGTVGGSLAHNDPAAELPLVMRVLEAEFFLSNGAETRTLPADEFFVSYFTTALGENELLLSVRVPALPDGWGWGFHEFSTRAGDFAIVAAAALARCRDGEIEEVRVGLAGVGERAVRAERFERAARGLRLDRLDEVTEAVREDISPLDDVMASAEYRRHLATVLAGRAVRDACSRSQGDMA
jgi:carbon-monoxide dehydrogenase medium subunit